MAELTNILENNFIPHKRAIHDCVDTGADFALLNGVGVLFPCDCGSRDYKSTTIAFWDKDAHLIKDTIDNAEMRVKIKAVLNGAANDICKISVYIPHPTFGNIPVDEIEWVLYKNNTDTLYTGYFLLYNSIDGEAKDYGFEVAIESTGDMLMKSRSILITS